MCMLDSVRVVRLLGVCIAGEPAMIVEEFLANGNLHTFLSKASMRLCGDCLLVDRSHAFIFTRCGRNMLSLAPLLIRSGATSAACWAAGGDGSHAAAVRIGHGRGHGIHRLAGPCASRECGGRVRDESR